MANQWNIIGNDWAVDLLQNQIKLNQLRHAYLFLGPSGMGKKKLSISFAKALNCIQPPSPGEYCNNCQHCLQIERTQHPDFFLLQRSESDSNIKVEAVRTLQHSLSLAPYTAEYRFAALINFQDANPNSANALLKTLEEPAKKVILVLTAETAESLLPTIVSRCEVIRLRPASIPELTRELISHAIPEDQADLLAHVSSGRPAYALSLHDNPQLLTQRNQWLEDHQRLLQSGLVERFKYAEQISKDKSIFTQLLYVWSSLWRDVLLKIVGADIPLENIDQSPQIESIAEGHTSTQAHAALSSLQNTLSILETNTNTRLAAEILVLNLPTN